MAAWIISINRAVIIAPNAGNYYPDHSTGIATTIATTKLAIIIKLLWIKQS